MNALPVAIGFRVEPKAVYWVAISGSISKPDLIEQGILRAPISYSEAHMLAWYREQAKLLFNQFSPHSVGVRETEPRAKNKSPKRMRIEGVLLEVSASKNLQIFFGAFNSISSNVSSKKSKRYLEKDDFKGLDISSYSKLSREALLTATAALSLIEPHESTSHHQLREAS